MADEKRVTLPSLDQKQFATLLSEVRLLLDRNEAYLALTPPFAARLVIDEAVLAEMAAKLEVDEKILQQQVQEVSLMILGVLMEQQDSMASYLVSRVHDRDVVSVERPPEQRQESEAKAKLFRTRMKSIAEVVVDKHLRNRFRLKVASKAPSFSGISWDVKVKVLDDADKEFSAGRVPYTTIRVEYQKQFSEDSTFVLGPDVFDAVQINLTRDDVEFLVRTLRRLSDSLAEFEEECEEHGS